MRVCRDAAPESEHGKPGSRENRSWNFLNLWKFFYSGVLSRVGGD
jgi:hypothetical protein